MPTAHLIHGFLGVGKTTLARRLAETVPAISF
jgi:predicted kinase